MSTTTLLILLLISCLWGRGFSFKVSSKYPQYKCLHALMEDNLETLQIPVKLKEMVAAMKNVPNDKLRYQQLLYLASQAAPLSDKYKVPENKVPGCLSTVYIHAEFDADEKIQFLGDSDSQLTKGLVAFLVKGLSGCSTEDIKFLSPSFLHVAGISQSLTPGRNNGLLNMLQLIKAKVASLKPSNMK